MNACLIEEFERLFLEKKEAENKFIEIFERLKILELNRDFHLEKVLVQEMILNELSIQIGKFKLEISKGNLLLEEKIKQKEIIEKEKELGDEKNQETIFHVF